MILQVVFTEDAEHDLEELVSYLATQDSPRAATHVLTRLLDIADSLSSAPTRGTVPRELRGLGDQEYRQVYFKPYRLIYRVIEQRVVIFVVADGRRDMQALLARRLLGG